MSGRPSSRTVRALAIEASSRPTSIAVQVGGETRALVLEGDRAHASDLVPNIETLLRECDLAPRDLELIVVGTGPGSYTGLRVAAATALGLRLGSGADMVGVPSFAAIARHGLAPNERGTVLRDAFGGFVYAATYQRPSASKFEVEREPWCGTPEQVRASTTLDAPVIFADERAMTRVELEEHQVADLRDVSALAEDVLTLGLIRYAETGDEGSVGVRPLYLRAFE